MKRVDHNRDHYKSYVLVSHFDMVSVKDKCNIGFSGKRLQIHNGVHFIEIMHLMLNSVIV